MAISKKISQLTALASASLNTQVVGVDNGSTVRVSLTTISNTIATTINDANDARLDSLEQYTSSAQGANLSSLNSFTSSYFTDSASFSSRITLATNEQSFAGLISGSSQLTSSYDTRYTLSGSITQTTWDNISGKPAGIVSQSTNITSLNSFTQSIDSRVDNLESWSSSLNSTFATDLEVSIVSSSVAATIGIISQATGLVTTSSFNSYTASISTASLVNRLNAIESASGSWITEIETGSFLTSLSGAISSSSQLTSSFDTRYTLSGSVQPLPSDLISSSAQITAFGFVSSSTTTPTGTISGSAQISAFGFISTSVVIPDGTISGSSQLTASFDTRYAASGSAGSIPAGTISGSAQLTSSYDTRYETRGRGIISGSSQITGNLAVTSISSSLYVGGYLVPEAKFTVLQSKPMTFWPNITYELVRMTTGGGVLIGRNGETNDYGLRLDVSGSVRFTGNTTITGSLNVTQGITGSIAATNGIVSGSSQLPSLATTGSNTFNGNQIITGSLTISSGSFFATQITANTASLYLTSGSNLYVQNNALVEITGSLAIQSGSITMPNRPAFRVVGNGGSVSSPTILSGSNLTVDYNQGNHWNNTTGIFTAPIAGLYQVNVVGRTNSNSLNEISQIIVYKNSGGSDITQIMIEWGPNTSANHIGGSTISRLAVGDTLRAQIGAGTISFDGNDNFSVAYIG